MSFRRDWDGKEWETFSRKLVQSRHGPHNVQNVPDKVKGDAGIEFFTADGCAYQSYAPEETANVSKAAAAMKSKITRDLPKLIKRAEDISALLGPIKIKRWIMLCPFLDDKGVISHAHLKAKEVLEANLPFVDEGFLTLVHGPDQFNEEIDKLRIASLGTPVVVQPPSQEHLDVATNDIDKRLDEKLGRAFPAEDDAKIFERRQSHIRTFLYSENILESLKVEHPILWEKAMRTIGAEEARLEVLGNSSALAHEVLKESSDRLEAQLRNELPNLENDPIVRITLGRLSDWLIRCPLDFPEPT